MQIAAVINVAPGEAALSKATQTQNLLLDHLGSKLRSIRLAVPRLMRPACLGALAEKPDMLLVAGGPRSARRAAQIAYAHRLPILFLPGQRSPSWARGLWGSLSVEDMIAALANGALTPRQLPAGVAGSHIFFGSAYCGGPPHIRQLRDDLAEAETLSAAAKLVAETASACGRALRPPLSVNYRGTACDASAVRIGMKQGSFDCLKWRHGPWARAHASLRAVTGRDWKGKDEPERFACTTLRLDAGDKTWLLLDGEAMALEGPVEIRYLPNTVKTFAFASDRSFPSNSDEQHRPSQGTTGGPPTFDSWLN